MTGSSWAEATRGGRLCVYSQYFEASEESSAWGFFLGSHVNTKAQKHANARAHFGSYRSVSGAEEKATYEQPLTAEDAVRRNVPVEWWETYKSCAAWRGKRHPQKEKKRRERQEEEGQTCTKQNRTEPKTAFGSKPKPKLRTRVRGAAPFIKRTR